MNFRWLTTMIILGLAGGSFLPCNSWSAEPLRTIRPDSTTGTSSAVISSAPRLVQTTQIQPLDSQGVLVGGNDPARQIERLLANLQTLLESSGSHVDRVVKLNLYVVRDDLVAPVQKSLSERFRAPLSPAVSFVTTRLPHPEALVGVDALAVHDGPVPPDQGNKSVPATSIRHLSSSIVTTQTLYFVSGQAENGASLGEATRKTLSSLEASLKFCGRTKQDVRQIKCFLTPMTQVADVRRELEAFYAGGPVPPVSFVEWQSTLPIEIEVLADGTPEGDLEPAGKLVYLTPPGMKPSPVFSRICRIHETPLIFVSGLHGQSGSNGTQQVEAIFSELGEILKEAGSDFKHLVKATYYVSQDEPSQKLNELRPHYYDPLSPPSASKAQVTGVGKAGTGLTLDMIAVPNPE